MFVCVHIYMFDLIFSICAAKASTNLTLFLVELYCVVDIVLCLDMGRSLNLSLLDLQDVYNS